MGRSRPVVRSWRSRDAGCGFADSGRRSGSSGSLTSPCATSIRKPSTPRSNQNRRIDSNSACTSGCCQLRSGCSGAYRWRYHSPSGRRVHAGPPKQETQSLGGSAPSGPRPGRKTYRWRSGLPGPADSAAWNQAYWSEVWFGTMSGMTRIPYSWASSMNCSASAMVPRGARPGQARHVLRAAPRPAQRGRAAGLLLRPRQGRDRQAGRPRHAGHLHQPARRGPPQRLRRRRRRRLQSHPTPDLPQMS